MNNCSLNLKRRQHPPLPGVVWISFLLVSLLAACGLQNPQTTATALALEVSVQEAASLRDQGAFILDVREPDEWVQFHIPGATLIPLGDLPNRLNEIPTDQTIVVVCRSGHRSASGRDILIKAGFSQVTSMAGGVTAWQVAGLPITSGQ
jgi:rhodanese-related sulfurtransferase